MNFEQAFTVAAPIEDVWAALMDIDRSALCMPGTKVLDSNGVDAYRVRVGLKLGPLSMAPSARLRIVERDDTARVATIAASATEADGSGHAEARVRLGAVPAPPGTGVSINAELQLSGTAAIIGKRLAGELAPVFLRQFALNLERQIAHPATTAPAELPLTQVAGTVIRSRARESRTLVLTALGSAVIGYVLGSWRARSRHHQA
jgi:carbon monoxide dehydrogenase subunit G